MRLSKSSQLFHNQTVLMTLVLRLIMNDSFSCDSVNRKIRMVSVSSVNRGYIAGDRRQNGKTKLVQVHEQSEFTHSG